MEFLLGIWAWFFAVTMLWPFWVGLVVITFFLCADDDFKIIGLLSTIIIGSVVVRMMGWEWDDYKLYLFAYPVVGVLWSFYRFGRLAEYIREYSHTKQAELEEYTQYKNNSESKWKEWRQRYQRDELRVTNNVDRISYWIASWPVSVMTWGLRDLLNLVKRFITIYAVKIYESISERHIEK